MGGLWGAYRGKRSADAYLGYGYGGYSGEWNGDHGYGGSGLWGAYRGKRSADASYGYGGGYGGYGGYGRGYGGYAVDMVVTEVVMDTESKNFKSLNLETT